MILAQIPPRNAVSGHLSYRAPGMELGDAIGLVGKLKCSTLRRAENILRCTHQAQYVMTYGTQQAHKMVMCLLCAYIVCLMCAHAAEVRGTLTTQKYGQFPVQRW